MPLTEILLIALALSMDAFAVSVASGTTMTRLNVPHALKMGAFFGGFQALMPVLGWLAGRGMKVYIEAFDHWLAFGLLTAVGGKMIYESLRIKEEEECGGERSCPFHTWTLTVLAVATSIDALAVGLTFSFLKVSIAAPVLIIGAVTFLMSVAGVRLGSAGGHFFEHRMEAAGGVILVLIGLKILLSHLGFIGF
ncbi:MAG TPA: manganese efflux pump MntP family protein [Elusimicrobiales bacterium]|nr:manganese efflux pump MntP family protein [Elusimicrobiales bacterium]